MHEALGDPALAFEAAVRFYGSPHLAALRVTADFKAVMGEPPRFPR